MFCEFTEVIEVHHQLTLSKATIHGNLGRPGSISWKAWKPGWGSGCGEGEREGKFCALWTVASACPWPWCSLQDSLLPLPSDQATTAHPTPPRAHRLASLRPAGPEASASSVTPAGRYGGTCWMHRARPSGERREEAALGWSWTAPEKAYNRRPEDLHPLCTSVFQERKSMCD